MDYFKLAQITIFIGSRLRRLYSVRNKDVPWQQTKTGSPRAGRAYDYNYMFKTMTRLLVGNRSPPARRGTFLFRTEYT